MIFGKKRRSLHIDTDLIPAPGSITLRLTQPLPSGLNESQSLLNLIERLKNAWKPKCVDVIFYIDSHPASGSLLKGPSGDIGKLNLDGYSISTNPRSTVIESLDLDG